MATTERRKKYNALAKEMKALVSKKRIVEHAIGTGRAVEEDLVHLERLIARVKAAKAELIAAAEA